MNQNNLDETFRVKTLKILWGALLFSQAIYGVLLYYVYTSPDSEKVPGITGNYWGLISGVVACLGICLALYAYKTATNDVKKNKMKGLSVEKMSEKELCELYHPALMLYLGLSQMICTFGMVLSLFTYNLQYYLALTAISVTLFLAKHPSLERMKRDLNPSN